MRATVARLTAAPASGATWRPTARAALRVDRACVACADDEQQELQRAPAGPDAAPANGHRFERVPVLPPAASPAQALSVSEPSDPGEQEAERVAERVVAALSSGTPPEEGLGISAASRPAVQRAPDAEAPAPEAEGGFLVDDEATALPGQMRKGDFLRALRPAVCAAADGELVRAGRSTAGCPYLDRWFAYYEGRDARQVERSLRRYAPETAGATSAAGYIPSVSERVARGVRGWTETGQIPELPDGMTPDMLGGGGVLGGLVSGVAEAASSVARGIGGALSALGSLFFKADAGGAARGVDGAALGAQLGEGRALDGTSRSRMGAAFGYDFGAVRVHDDAPAAALAQGLNARAFTLGTHIAFGAGQHRPGQLAGDALLAHELAHVVQQGGARAEMPKEAPAEHDAVEQEADASAVAATLALWDPEHAGERAKPTLRSGLQLRRCGGGQQTPPVNAGMVAAAVAPLSQAGSAVCSPAQRQSGDETATCCTPSMLAEISGLRSQAAPLVQNAIARLQTPDGVSAALQAHFRITPTDTASLQIVVDQLTHMLQAMQGNEVRFLCSDTGDPLCSGLRARSSNCSNGAKVIQICASYTFSTLPEVGGQYLDGSHWLKTLIHEYAHIGCSGGGGILAAGSESYSQGGPIPYPPDNGRAIHNADSYANFVLAVRS